MDTSRGRGTSFNRVLIGESGGLAKFGGRDQAAGFAAAAAPVAAKAGPDLPIAIKAPDVAAPATNFLRLVTDRDFEFMGRGSPDQAGTRSRRTDPLARFHLTSSGIHDRNRNGSSGELTPSGGTPAGVALSAPLIPGEDTAATKRSPPKSNDGGHDRPTGNREIPRAVNRLCAQNRVAVLH